MNDNVNHPSHYQGKNGLEVIDVIDNFVGDLQGEKAVCMGNVIKYILRHTKKNGVEDLLKARWYLDRLISYYDKPNISYTDKAEEVLLLEVSSKDESLIRHMYDHLTNGLTMRQQWDYIVKMADTYEKNLNYVYVELAGIRICKTVTGTPEQHVLRVYGTLEDGVHAR